MDDEIEQLVVAVRADTRAFASDVAAMRAGLEGGLGQGADRAGRTIEAGLARAIRTGKLGFEDLKAVALAAMAQIAAASIGNGVGALLGGGGSGLIGGATSLLGSLLGLPGRATGGPVSPGAAYLVGERGPELFVPTASGRIAAAAPAPAREVRVAISVQAGGGSEARALERSSRQVARAVARALQTAER